MVRVVRRYAQSKWIKALGKINCWGERLESPQVFPVAPVLLNAD